MQSNQPAVTTFSYKAWFGGSPDLAITNKKQTTLEEAHRAAQTNANLNLSLSHTITGNKSVGACELLGFRNTQEDAFKGWILNANAINLSDSQWKTFFVDLCARLQNMLLSSLELDRKGEAIGYMHGSCFCSVTVIGNKIISANLGDSEAILVTIDDDKAEAKRINNLH